jgi:hypothetical protein
MLFDQSTHTLEDQLNKLFCTFTKKEELDYTITDIKSKYSVLYSKVFVLEIQDGDEYVCTYNIDSDNINKNSLLPSTILMHRRKETNTLYTINSLNSLVASLNNGVIDKNFKVNWPDYKNSILLTRSGEFRKLDTKIHDIVIFN